MPRARRKRRLHKGRERRLLERTLLEGPNLVTAALDGGVTPIEVYTVTGGAVVDRCAAAGAEVVETSDRVLDAISTTGAPQDPVAVVEIPEPVELEIRRTVVLVDVADPGNLGTLIRTAAALDWQVALLRGTDAWSPKVLRSGAGAHFARTPIRITDLAVITAVTSGFRTVATVVSGGLAPADITADRPIALLIGSESHGLARVLADDCDQTMTIPMSRATESLNAAVAGGIAMYALSRTVSTDSFDG